MSVDKQREKASALDFTILETEKVGGVAILEQAIALCDMQDSELYKLVQKEDGSYFPSWRQYAAERCSSKSETTIFQMIGAAREWRKEIGKEGTRLARIGIEKLYIVTGLISGGFIKREDALKLAEENSAKRLKEMKQTDQAGSEGLAPLTSDKFPRVLGSILENNITRMMAAMGSVGEKPTRIGAMEHILNTVTQLPDEYLADQVRGEGGLPTEVLGYDIETTPPAALVNILLQRYVDNGADIEELRRDVVSAIEIKAQIAREIKARKAAEEKVEKERIASAEKAVKAFATRVKGLRESDKVTFMNGLVAEIAVVENTGQKIGLRFGQDGKDFFAAIPVGVNGYEYKGGDSALVTYVFASGYLEGIKSVEKFKAAAATKKAPAPKPAKAAKPLPDLSKGKQVGKQGKAVKGKK